MNGWKMHYLKIFNDYLQPLIAGRRRMVAAGSAVTFFILVMLMLTPSRTDGIDYLGENTFEVTPRDFEIEVLTRGEVKPAQVIPIKSEISGNKSKLVWLIPEGTQVEQGTVLAQFDPAQYLDEKEQVEQKLADASATFAAAEKSLEIQKEEELKRTDNAAKQLEVSKLKVKDLLEGSGILQRRKLELELEQANRSLKIADEELIDYKLLLEKGHVSRREYEKAFDNQRRFAEQMELRTQELENFDKYEWPKLKREAEIQTETAEAEYRRAIRLSELEISKRQAQLTKAARDVQRHSKKLEQINRNILLCDVKAPINGTVFYKSLPRSEGVRKIQVGDNIWTGQTFMEIPDTNNLVLQSSVREFDVNLVTKGQDVKVRLDAFSDRVVLGKVSRIDKVVAEENQQGISRFTVIIDLFEEFQGIHPGMSGQASVVVERKENVLSVPVNYVFSDIQGEYVWLLEDERKYRRYLTFGNSNHAWRQVSKGIDEGDVISL